MSPIDSTSQAPSTLTRIRIVVVAVTAFLFVLLLVAYIWGPQLLREVLVTDDGQTIDESLGILTDIRSLTGLVTEVGDGYLTLGLENVPPMMDASLKTRRIQLPPEVVVERESLRPDSEREQDLRAFYTALGLPFDGEVATSLPPGFAVDPETGNAYPTTDMEATVTAVENAATNTSEIVVPQLPPRYNYQAAQVSDLQPGMIVGVVASDNIFSTPVITPTRIIIQTQ